MVEEAGDDAGRGDRLEAGLEAPVAEEAARLVFARGEAAARGAVVGEGDGHASPSDGDVAGDPAGVVLLPAVGPAVGLATPLLVVPLQVVDAVRRGGAGRSRCHRRRPNAGPPPMGVGGTGGVPD